MMRFEEQTPIHQIQSTLFREFDVDLSLKRDDLIHPFISGNKWRKLKYNLSAFKESDCRGIATFGGAFSNHLIATACLCAGAGIKSVAIVRGDELGPKSNFVLRLCHEFGMELRFVTRAEYRDKSSLAGKLADDGYFVIPEGGDNDLGVRGCAEIVPNHGVGFDHIVVSIGTGTTFKGILSSVGESTHVHGVAAIRGAETMTESIRKGFDSSNWTVHNQFAGKGFGSLDEDILQFGRKLCAETGILFDPIYTARMMWAIHQLLTAGTIDSGSKILAIHTGGMTGLLSESWKNTI